MPQRTDAIHRQLRGLALRADPEPDADLLGRFLADRDEDSFADLVRRHGPMVLSVCRRVLGRAHDADDAFQATFLLLARRASSVRPRSLLANWLYGVAYRTAREARRAAAVRRVKEQRAAQMRRTVVVPDVPEPDFQDVLDRELAALPEAYRAAVVVCDLEGLSRREAAARLGWTEGAVAGRLARGREALARKLAGYGLAVPAALGAAPPCVAAGLAESTARLGVLVAAGEAAAVAAPVAALTQGVMKAMLVTKLKGMTAAVMVGCAVLVTAAAGWQAEAAPQDRPTVKSADVPKKAGRDADKDRIAELERERDRLLKMVADLQVRLDALERDRAAEKAKEKQARAAEENARRLEFLKSFIERNPADPARPALSEPATLTPPVGVSPATPSPVVPGGASPTPARTTPVPASGVAPPASRQGGATPSPGSRPVGSATPPALDVPGSASPDSRPPRTSPPVDVPSSNPGAAPRGAGLVTKVYSVDELASDDKQAEALIRVIRRAAAAGTWDVDGGAGVVEYFQVGRSLVVRNTSDAHKELGELLGLLKEAAGKRTGRPPRPGDKP
jgi:RNA polymerase sigma factor (sigma-70 family)